MKKKLFGITIIVVIIGIIVVALKGFNVNFKYKEHKAITIPINTDFNINDIQSIADEMFGKNTCYLEKAGIYNDEVIINVKDITEEQIESLKNKVNEHIPSSWWVGNRSVDSCACLNRSPLVDPLRLG